MAGYPEDMKYIFICIERIKDKEVSGYITNAYLKEKKVFYCIKDMVYAVNSIMQNLMDMHEKKIPVLPFYGIKNMLLDLKSVKRIFCLKMYCFKGEWKGVLSGSLCQQGIPFENTDKALRLMKERLKPIKEETAV